MATYFGEVKFPSSRAFWDDDDEYEQAHADEAKCSSKLHMRWLQSKPEHIQRFIVIEGDPLISFAEQYLCFKEEVCIIENEDHKKISVIYQNNKQIYLCIILQQFDTKYAGKFVNQIYDLLLISESIISIVSNHESRYQSEKDLYEEAPFLRILSTKKADITKSKIKRLKIPTLVFGVGAGVLSCSEFIGIPAKLYILYHDSTILDSKSAEPILEILTTEIPDILIKSQQSKQSKFTNNFFTKGNLYM